jgi:hypothetical protein
MRFGVALDLWAKDFDQHTPDTSADYQPAPKRQISGLPLQTPNMTKKQSDLILKMVDGNIHYIEEWKTSKGIKGTLDVGQASQLIEWLKDNVPKNDPWKDIPKGGSDEEE